MYKLKSWGLEPDPNSNKSILSNYIEYLACDGISLKGCADFDADCNKINQANLVVVNCNLKIVGLSFNLDQNPTDDISFYLGAGDIFGAKQPLTYAWNYDTNIFTLVGDTHSPLAKFKVKNNRRVDLLVTPITLNITDANGCSVSKTCYYTPTGVKCNNNFQPCYPDTSLQVAYNFVPCAKAKNLVVNPH